VYHVKVYSLVPGDERCFRLSVVVETLSNLDFIPTLSLPTQHGSGQSHLPAVSSSEYLFVPYPTRIAAERHRRRHMILPTIDFADFTNVSLSFSIRQYPTSLLPLTPSSLQPYLRRHIRPHYLLMQSSPRFHRLPDLPRRSGRHRMVSTYLHRGGA